MPEPGANWLPTRTSLLKRLRDHSDAESWESFCDSYGRVIHAVAMKSGLSQADAEDITQETLVSVAKRINAFDYDPQKGSFKSWLLTVARSRIIDTHRRRQRENRFQPVTSDDTSQTDLLAQVPDEQALSIDRLYEEEWRRGLYEAARDHVRERVAPQQYQAFDLYVVREWSPEKVAEVLEVTVNQVYLAKHRVSSAIKDEVNRLEAGIR